MELRAYLRVSGRGQVDGDGFPRQRAAIETYAAANGVAICAWYMEKGISGCTDWDARPAWVDMISELQPGQGIIVERLDRLARDLGVQEFILRDLKKRGISLYSTAEPDLASSDPTRILFRQIIGAVAAYERSMIEVKLRHARERQRKKHGRCEGRKPFGHRDGEQHAIEIMQKYSQAGFTTRTIADALNRENLRTRSGRPWKHGTVAKILTAHNLPLSR